MARKPAPTTRRQRQRQLMAVPAPPVDESTEALNVEIRTSVSWRLKLALLHLESEGRKTSKKAFVESAIAEALKAFE